MKSSGFFLFRPRNVFSTNLRTFSASFPPSSTALANMF
ncbi:MAG: hypothetical protein GF383_00355 [Candidatus Lokiarchaeota archaeon]|nr:hypothetical protein [Candidatus Lokiarchaeota archaeon]MBD3337594.1 hypothetical protein [Candidatus Lokiarchaeota archaeon]